MNHFYDPVHNRGLTHDPSIDPLINVGTWQKSKEWAVDEENQNKTTYKVPAAIASILTAIQHRSIETISTETNFTWQQAIRYWLKGEEEKALFMLGHVVHLIEDAAVPDHARNDAHPPTDSSPYEEWTGKFTLTNVDSGIRQRLENKTPSILGGLESYFEELANYSNNNFYSKDTVGLQSGYKNPQPEFYPRKVNGLYFAFKEGGVTEGDQLLFLIKNYSDGDNILTLPSSVVSLNDPQRLVMKDYWSRLSTKAVQYGAGVVGLFFREVERAKLDPSFLGEPPKSFVANALETTQRVILATVETLKNVGSTAASAVEGILARFSGEQENIEDVLSESVEIVKDLLGDVPSDDAAVISEDERAQLRALQNQLDDISDVVGDLTYQVDVVIRNEGRGGAQEITNGTEDTDSMDSVDNGDDADISSAENANISSGGGGGGGVAAAPAPNFIITEIFYNVSGADPGKEWVEIKNSGTSAANPEDVRFLEGGTNHRLTFVRGSATLSAGAYAVLADDADQFLADYPTFSGNLFDSSFSLSNDGEALALVYDGSTFHSVSYSSSTGAYGDGNSLQLVGLAWGAASPTPGAVNVAPTSSGSSSSEGESSATSTATSSPPTTGFGAYHVVISEVQVAGAGPGDEFIELYNPTDAAVDISGWSLQYAGAGAEISTSTMESSSRRKLFLATSSIAAKGFYLVGRGNCSDGDVYTGSVELNMTYCSLSLSGNSSGAKIFLVPSHEPIESEADPSILDVFDYTSTTIPNAGGSFERRAWSNNLCHSAIVGGTGEFLGNGCDTGVFADDFETRPVSNPQNTGSFIEPRAAPSVPQPPTSTSALASFNSSSVAIDFAWQPSVDFQGATSTLTYRITNASTSLDVFNATSTLFSSTVTEVGRSYLFVMQAFDRDGMGSATTSITVDAPSFLDTLYFYRDPRASSTDYLIDLYYPQYPFIPDRYSSGDYWHMPVFYLNRAAPGSTSTHVRDPEPIPAELLEGIVAMKFRDCGDQPDEINVRPVLPDVEPRCVHFGPTVNDVSFSLLEDPHLRLTFASSSNVFTLSESDYLTVAFYDYSTPTWACACRMFSLVATDATRYHFGSSTPSFATPELPDALTTEFDDTSSRLIVRWATSTDVDTLDNLLTYDITFSTSTVPSESEWESAGPQPHADLDDQTFISHRYLRHVMPGDTFTIGIRAKDEFGVTSTVRTTVWQYPAVAEIFSQATSTGWSNAWGQKNSGHPQYPVRASLQSIVSTSTLTFDVATVRVWQEGSGSPSTLRLGVFADDGANKPLLTSKIGEAMIDQLGDLATSTDLAFTFATPVTLSASTKYWFGLDVTASGWDGRAGLFSSSWKNAIATGNAYPAGEAGIGAVEECTNNDYCGTTIPSPSGDADWYLKLYLRVP
ncbi:MAG: lamin tail domain-containing protein [Candidatus Jorgensenbacteria bacterium]|nr:lamin tail domain-containing protein [Candidatus Jorgensenbacteria bacterium]